MSLSHRCRVLLIAVTTLVGGVLPVSAQTDYYWNGGVGGAWIDGGSGWTTQPGNTAANWSNTSLLTANFTGIAPTAATIDNAGITAYGLNFLADGYTVNGGTLTLAGAGAGAVGVGSGLTGTINAVVAGSTGLTKTGDGKLVLGAANTFSGDTVVNGGILQLNVGGGTGTIRGSLTINAGALVNLNASDALGYNGQQITSVFINNGTIDNLTNSNNAYSTNFTLTAGTMSSTGGGAYNFADGFGISTNASSTASVVSSNMDLRFGNINLNVAAGSTPDGVDLRISGAIFDGGALVKNGNGVLVLTSYNSFSGGFTINAGTVVSTTGGYATGIGRGNVLVKAGATLRGDGGDAFGYDPNNSPGLITLNGGTITTGTNGNYRVTLPNITFDGGGTISSGNAGDNTATLSVYAGGAAVGQFSVVNPGATTALINAASLGIQPGTLNFTVAAGTAASQLTISATLKDFGGGTHAITKDGAGTVILTSFNQYSGGTTVNAGTLVSASSGNGSGLSYGDVTVNAGGTLRGDANDAFGYDGGVSPALITIAGGAVTSGTNGNYRVTLPVVTFTGGGTLSSGVGNTGDTNGNFSLFSQGNATAQVNVLAPANTTALISASAISLQQGNTNFNVAAGTAASQLTVSSVIQDFGSSGHTLTKSGSGTLLLTAANIYSGGTVVNGGILRIGATNALPNTSTITLNSGTLSSGASTGFSNALGTLNVAGTGTIALGTGPHAFSFVAFDPTNFTGLTITGWTGPAGGSGTQGQITFADPTAFNASVLAAINFTGYPSGASILGTELVPVPEPVGLLLAGLAGLTLRRVRRNH